MPTTCDIIDDALIIADSLAAEGMGALADSLTFSEQISAVACGILPTDTLTIADTAQGFDAVKISDTLHIADALAVRSASKNVIADSAQFSETLVASVADKPADALHISDSMTPSPMFDSWTDSLALTEQVAQHINRADVAADSLTIGDRLFDQIAATLADTLHVSDSASNIDRGQNTVADALHISDTAGAATTRLIDYASDSLTIADAASHRASIANAAGDVLYIADELGAIGEAGAAWSCSTDLYAMTRWTHRQLTAIGLVSGFPVVAGEGGIYALAGANDAGSAIAAHSETGLIQVGVPEARDINARDTGDPSIKRADGHAYMAYSGGRLRFGIGITYGGTEQQYWYDFPAATATAPTINRAKIGRGAKSGFWRFMLENVEGDGFMVKEQRVMLDPTSRRV